MAQVLIKNKNYQKAITALIKCTLHYSILYIFCCRPKQNFENEQYFFNYLLYEETKPASDKCMKHNNITSFIC